MKGVRFIRQVFPWQAQATALLPAGQADLMIREGFAVPHYFPDRPYAVDASVPREAVIAPASSPVRPTQSYKTKRRG